jgi:hypothetical protein
MAKQWRTETPNSERALLDTLNKLSKEGWEIFDIISGGSGVVGARRFTVVAYKEVAN